MGKEILKNSGLNCRRAIILTGLILMMGVFLTSCVSAFEFDNTKVYDEITNTISVYDCDLWIGTCLITGDKIAEITLNTPHLYLVAPGENREVAEFTIIGYENYKNAFNGIKLYNIFGEEINRNIIYKEKVIKGKKETKNFKDDCIYNENKTSCIRKQISSAYEDIVEWKDIDIGDGIKKGEIIIGLFTEVYKEDNIEWIPTLFGAKIEEWAVWQSSYNIGLIGWWKFDETSGTNYVESKSGTLNGTAFGGFNWSSDGIINGATGLMKGQLDVNDYINITNSHKIGNFSYTNSFSYSGWINTTFNNSGDEAIISQTSDDYGWILGKVYYNNGTGNMPSIFFSFQNGDGNGIVVRSALDLTNLTNLWTQIGFVYNGTHDAVQVELFVNGVQTGTSILRNTSAADNTYIYNLRFGNRNYSVVSEAGRMWYFGKFDEFGLWNRTLSSSEMSDLYNEGAGISYSPYSYPSIILNYPINYINQSSKTISFNCSATDTDGTIQNITLNIDSILNHTVIGSAAYLDMDYSRDLAEGNHNWSCYAVSSLNARTNSSLRNITIDLTQPEINILSPTNETVFTDSATVNVSFNVSVSDINLESCWYFNGTTNNSIVCGENATIILPAGEYLLRSYANDSAGNLAQNATYFIISPPVLNITSEIYNTTTTETAFEDFIINITYTSSLWNSLNAYLIYNGTEYSGVSSGTGDIIVFSKTLQISSVEDITNQTFYWKLVLTNSTSTIYVNSSFHNQTINIINFGLCGGSLDIPVINFTTENETDLEAITGFSFAGTFEVWAGGGGAVSKINSTMNLTGVNSIAFCISEDATLYINANIDYSKTDYSLRSYYLRNAMVNNVTNNITLYLLSIGLSKSIIISVKDEFLSPLKNHLVNILRYYPGLNAYYLVETAKTDDFGNALIKVQEEDVDYRIQIENSTGSLIYTSNPMRIICTNSPCQLEFITGATENVMQNLLDFQNVDYTLEYDNETKYILFQYSDSSGLSKEMRMVVTKTTGWGDSIVPGCDTIVYGSAGIISCFLNDSGTFTARVYRSASPFNPFATLTLALTNMWETFGVEGLLWMFLFTIVMFFVGLSISPSVAAITTLVSIVFMMFTGIVYMPFVVCISIAVVVIIFISKMRS